MLTRIMSGYLGGFLELLHRLWTCFLGDNLSWKSKLDYIWYAPWIPIDLNLADSFSGYKDVSCKNFVIS